MESKFLAVSNIFDGKEPQLAGGNQMVISSITEDLNSSKKHTRLVVSAGLESRIAVLRVRHAADYSATLPTHGTMPGLQQELIVE